VPCNPTNASTLGALSSAKLGTLGAISSIELQSTLRVISSTKVQGTLGVANFVSLCRSSSKGVPNAQGLIFSTQGLASREPTNKRKKEVKIKKVFKKKWVAQFP
jgi:hypothetical protein